MNWRAEQLDPPRRTARAKRRVLMHVIDAGDCGDCGEQESDVVLQCARCGHTTDWTRLRTTDAKRGVPCPCCAVPTL